MTDAAKTIFIADRTTIGLLADKEGKLKITAAQLADGATVLKGQILEITNQNGQVRATIKPAPRTYSRGQLLDEVAQADSPGEIVDRLVKMFRDAGEAA